MKLVIVSHCDSCRLSDKLQIFTRTLYVCVCVCLLCYASMKWAIEMEYRPNHVTEETVSLFVFFLSLFHLLLRLFRLLAQNGRLTVYNMEQLNKKPNQQFLSFELNLWLLFVVLNLWETVEWAIVVFEFCIHWWMMGGNLSIRVCAYVCGMLI